MCGILAVIDSTVDDALLLRAVRTLDHRGPDGRGVYVDAENAFGMAHTRLAVMDVEGGAQPLFSESRDIALVANGEIYDFERIRSDLEALGHTFATASDSEVILHLYERYGPDFTDYLRGEFAFVLYDRIRRKVIAVRDRFGIKPLYLHHADGTYVLASEAKAIFATRLHTPAIDPVAVRNYMHGALPDSIFKGVWVVPPASVLEIDLESRTHQLRSYWTLDLTPENTPGDGEQHRERLRAAFDESVRLRLRADVPVGVYLSGGIDSAIVAATAARDRSEPLDAFTVAFHADPAYDEEALAHEMADHIGARFHVVACPPEVLARNAEGALWASEFPFFNFHGVGKYCLSRLASEHVKVVLTGEGADEVFLGYPHFKPHGRSTLEQMMSGDERERTRDRAGDGGTGPPDEVTRRLGFLPVREHARTFQPGIVRLIRRLFHPRHFAELDANSPVDALAARVERRETDPLPLVRKIQYFGIRGFLAPYILGTLGDRAEMAHGIEGRTPFLDHHLFEVARQIPDGDKIRGGVEKAILRETFGDRVTDRIAGRTKWPYAAPPTPLGGRKTPMGRLAKRYLSRKAIRRGGIFNSWAIGGIRVASRLCPARSSLARRLHVLLVFCLSVQILEQLFVGESHRRTSHSASA